MVQKVILHVEDEEGDVILFEQAMDMAGAATPIRVATDGRQAISYFKGEDKFANRTEFPFPSLVLLDLKLPFIPGLEVLRWIRREAHLTIPVLMLSSSENEADIAAAYQLGANAYLVKPNELAKLVETAKAIQHFWLALNRPPPERRPGSSS
jgi:DNA-binding response OmpR family regulator